MDAGMSRNSLKQQALASYKAISVHGFQLKALTVELVEEGQYRA